MTDTFDGSAKRSVAAVVLAAGKSERMGRPKMLLPWGDRTVIEQIVHTLSRTNLAEILVVTGGARSEVENVLVNLPVHLMYNSRFAEGGMLSSFQVGLSVLGKGYDAALVVLGDQPQIEAWVVELVIEEYYFHRSPLVIPSYQKRRGHPWLIERSLWHVVQAQNPPLTLRDFLSNYQDHIRYIDVETPTILLDLDTPEDYQHYRPTDVVG
jgi:molybdenum cofactor cytidylyltransferase